MSIKLFITGGTIDKEYDSVKGETALVKTHLPEMLKEAKNKATVRCEIIMLKYSCYMNNRDRKKILEKCKKAKENKIIITHGTDKMEKTAQILGKNISEKTIVLTGSMRPFSFGQSDASFNLGVAIGAVQFLPAGIFIAMNGKIFPWNNARKNTKAGRFENIK